MSIDRSLAATAVGLLIVVNNCAAAELSIGPLRLRGLEGFERQADDGQRTHLRNRSGVDVIISVFSMSAEAEATKFGGDSERRLKFQEEGARKVYDGSLRGGDRAVPIGREDLPNGNTLFSGAIRNSSLFHSGYFLIYLFVAPAQRMALITVEGKGDAVEEYRRYRTLFDTAEWQEGPGTAEAVAFTERVATKLRAKFSDVTVSVKAPLTLSVGEVQANLDRIYSFCSRDAVHCDSEIDRYAIGVDETLRAAHQPVSRDAVRLIVRTASYFKSAQGALGGADPGFQPRPLPGGLVILPAIDSPATIRMLSSKGIKELDLSVDEIYQLGEANLRKSLKPIMEAAKAVGKSQIGTVVSDPYNSGRLALIDSWSPLAQAQGGTLIVAAPANDSLVYIGEDSAVAIDALRSLVRNLIQRAPSPLSETLLRWSPSGWEVVP
jgi:hypothetical protein